MTTETKSDQTGLKIGDHQFRVFTGLDVAFGANESDYPAYQDIPEEHRAMRGRHADVFSKLFFNGGKLEDHGLRLKPDVDPAAFFSTFRALASSFAPKHEVKTGTCAWLLAEYCEDD